MKIIFIGRGLSLMVFQMEELVTLVLDSASYM